MGKRRIAAYLFHRNDEFPRLDNAARVNRCPLVLHRRRGFARDGGLCHRCVTAQDTPVNHNLLTRVHSDDVSRAHLLDGHLSFDLAVRRLFDEPDIALPKREQSRDVRARLLRRIARQHLRTVAEGKEHEARLGLACKYRGDDSRRRQRICIRLPILNQSADSRLDEVARDAEHEQRAQHRHRRKELGGTALQQLHRCKARQRDQCITSKRCKLLRRCHSLRRGLTHGTLCRRQHTDSGDRSLVPDIDTALAHGCRRYRREAAHPCCQAQRILTRDLSTQPNARMYELHTFHPLISVSAHQSICEPDGVLFESTSCRMPRRTKMPATTELRSSAPPVFR